MGSFITLTTSGQGLYEFTGQVVGQVIDSGIENGLCTLFIQHTSASLTIQENADPSAQLDLESWLNRLVPEGDSLYTHTFEGRDDMPAHIKAALTATSLSIPIIDYRWQPGAGELAGSFLLGASPWPTTATHRDTYRLKLCCF